MPKGAAYCPTCKHPLPRGATNPEVFVLDEERAIQEQLSEKLEARPWAPLTEGTAAKAVSMCGVYQLRVDGDLVYVGKTDDLLPTRLRRHARVFGGRQGLKDETAECRWLGLPSPWDRRTNEAALVRQYGSGHSLWNKTLKGFGSNDPGRERDTQKPSEFDLRYPVDEAYTVDVPAGPLLVGEYLKLVQGQLPYVLRYSGSKRKKPTSGPLARILAETYKPAMAGKLPAEKFLVEMCRAVPLTGWQLVRLRYGFILYREAASKQYPFGARLYP